MNDLTCKLLHNFQESHWMIDDHQLSNIKVNIILCSEFLCIHNLDHFTWIIDIILKDSQNFAYVVQSAR